MKLLLLFIITLHLYAIDQKSDISYNYLSYSDFENENLLSGTTNLKITHNEWQYNTTLDYIYSDTYSNKRYFDINELYLTRDFQNNSLTIGKQIKFWGELEGFNISDIFNQKRYFADPFDKNKKIGSFTINNTFYLENNSLEIGAKLFEEDLQYPNLKEPYSPFSLNYDSDLQSDDSRYKPTLYLKYSFLGLESLENENKIIFWHGYDSKRAIVVTNQSTLAQKTYLSSKLLYLSNFTYHDYIFKFEGSISDTQSNLLSDYGQFSFGGEKTIYDIKGSDLTLYTEYYKYRYFKPSLQKNIDISESYNNDLFFALRINLNDVRGTELKSGILYDLDNSEQIYKTDFQTRIEDGLVLNAQILKIKPKENTVLTPFGNSSRIIFGLTYSF